MPESIGLSRLFEMQAKRKIYAGVKGIFAFAGGIIFVIPIEQVLEYQGDIALGFTRLVRARVPVASFGRVPAVVPGPSSVQHDSVSLAQFLHAGCHHRNRWRWHDFGYCNRWH